MSGLAGVKIVLVWRRVMRDLKGGMARLRGESVVSKLLAGYEGYLAEGKLSWCGAAGGRMVQLDKCSKGLIPVTEHKSRNWALEHSVQFSPRLSYFQIRQATNNSHSIPN